jgi:hypothetical protein
MFAQNVTVATHERLRSEGAEQGEWYQRVTCATCGADVGVRDQAEVYHFFDVFPS